MSPEEAVLARHGRSFHLASRLLPPDRRQAAATLYAFCRHVDDLADDHQDLEGLQQVRQGPWMDRVLDLGVPADAVHHLLNGVTSDLEHEHFEDDAQLMRYCYQVAGTVGLMMCSVLGVTDRDALPHAVDLGVGMQLTNICRDVKEDHENGRKYLPGVPDRDAVRHYLTLAEAYYASAEAGLPAIPWRSRAAIAVASAVYRQIGRRLLRTGGDPWVGRTIVPLWEKLWVGAVALLRLPFHRRRAHRAGLHQHLRGLPGCT